MQIIDGKLVAKVTREQIKQEVEGLKALNYPNAIGLAVILVGDDPASQVYVRNKIKACDEVGIKSFLCKLPPKAPSTKLRVRYATSTKIPTYPV